MVVDEFEVLLYDVSPELYEVVPCRGTAPNLSLDLDARRQTHFFWDACEVAAEGSETSLRESRAFSASVPPYTPRHSHRRALEGSLL